MPLRNYWAEAQHNPFLEELVPNADSTTHVYTYSTYIPNSAHIKKLVCSAGISIRGSSAEDITNLGRPMSWVHGIQMVEPSSDAYPSGRVVTLNKQAGGLVMQQCSQAHLAPAIGVSETIWSRVVTTYSADIHPIDQAMSYGSVTQSIGIREIAGAFYVHGVHASVGNPYASVPHYLYSASMVLRVLYELEVEGTGGGG